MEKSLMQATSIKIQGRQTESPGRGGEGSS